jgi:hypothetical protein
MNNTDLISIDKQVIEKIIYELSAIQLFCEDKFILERVKKVSNLIRPYADNNDEVSIRDIIYDRMQETRMKDEDLHFQLYMLHRKLAEGQITESQAKYAYEQYVKK